MKKLLLGTTALATAALLSAGTANAAEGLTMSVTGYFTGVMAFGDNGVANGRGVSFEDWDNEIWFTAEGVADNGLKYGFRVELEANTTGDQIDEQYMWLSGGFGKIIFGEDDGASEKMGYTSPAPDNYGILSVNSGNYVFGSTPTTINNTGDGTKLTYITPRIAGFQLGLSYAPEACEDRQGCLLNDFGVDNDGAGGQQFSAGLNFSKEFSGISVGLSGTYVWQEDELGIASVTDDQTSFGFGLNIGFAAGAGTVTTGASYLKIDNLGTIDGDDYEVYDAGVQYAQGPFTIGVQSIWADYSAPTIGVDGDVWAMSIGGGYELAAGLGLSAGYIHYDRDSSLGTSLGAFDADVFMVGSKLSF